MYAGGHKIVFDPVSSKQMKITVNNQPFEVQDQQNKPFKVGRHEIFK